MGNEATRFKKGQSIGRKVGATNKVTRLVKDVVSDVFNHLQTDPHAKKKKADLKSWAKEHPKDFYQIAAKLIPVQMQHTGGLIINWNEQLTDDTEPKTEQSP